MNLHHILFHYFLRSANKNGLTFSVGTMMDCGSPAGNSEPEDLSSPITMGSTTTSHSMAQKYSMHEASLLSFQRSMLPNERAALFNAGLGNSSMMRDVITDSVGGDSSGRGGSPQLSDRSTSPQDLTIKSSDNRDTGYGGGEKSYTSNIVQ